MNQDLESSFNQLKEYLSDGFDLLRLKLNLTHKDFTSRINQDADFLAKLKGGLITVSFEEFQAICAKFKITPIALLQYCQVCKQWQSGSSEECLRVIGSELSYQEFKESQ